MIKKCIIIFATLHTMYAQNFIVPEEKILLRQQVIRCSSFPYIAPDTFRAIADHIIDETKIPFNPERVQRGDIVYLNADFIDFYFTEIHHLIMAPYILITHNSLNGAPGNYYKHLDDDHLVAWFAKNFDGQCHPKMHPIPLGLPNNYWPHGDTKVLESVIQQVPFKKDKLLYLNYNAATNKDARMPVAQFFWDKPYCIKCQRKPYREYLIDMAQSYFVLSPEGAGVDCHRTWEALLVGSIPIVPSTSINELYQDLPIVVVDDWTVIDEEFLKTKYVELMDPSRSYSFDKLLAPYWIDQIKAVQNNVRKDTQKKCVDFHQAMSPSKLYDASFVKHFSDWQLAYRLYENNFVCQESYCSEGYIPKIIHHIWLGSSLPEACKKFRQTWYKYHPDWTHILWVDTTDNYDQGLVMNDLKDFFAEVPTGMFGGLQLVCDIRRLKLHNQEVYDATLNLGKRSDIARYEILYHLGGLYVDTDFECVRSFDELHHCSDFYAGIGFGESVVVFNGLIGAKPKHFVLNTCMATLPKMNHDQEDYISILTSTGPYFFTAIIKHCLSDYAGPALLMPNTFFYPWPNYARDNNSREHIRSWVQPESFSVHHWHVSWNDGVPL